MAPTEEHSALAQAPSAQFRRFRPVLLVVALVATPLLAGVYWRHASDNPFWPVFRSMLNLCDVTEGPLAPVSLDGRYTAHVANANCFGRFPEQMVFVTSSDEGFTAATADPNHAVFEAAGLRTIDAIIWHKTPDSKPLLEVVVRKEQEYNIHRVADSWSIVKVRLANSNPAEGASQID